MASDTPTTEIPGLRKQAADAGSFVAQYVTTTVKVWAHDMRVGGT
jgi:hypothetical protein